MKKFTMNQFSIILLITFILATCNSETTEATKKLLAIESPSFFADQPSPLLKPKESLQKKEYYDFLSTLYRHDKTKASLFEPNTVPSDSVAQRRKRTIMFRPLFGYRRQQVRLRKTKRY